MLRKVFIPRLNVPEANCNAGRWMVTLISSRHARCEIVWLMPSSISLPLTPCRSICRLVRLAGWAISPAMGLGSHRASVSLQKKHSIRMPKSLSCSPDCDWVRDSGAFFLFFLASVSHKNALSLLCTFVAFHLRDPLLGGRIKKHWEREYFKCKQTVDKDLNWQGS